MGGGNGRREWEGQEKADEGRGKERRKKELN